MTHSSRAGILNDRHYRFSDNKLVVAPKRRTEASEARMPLPVITSTEAYVTKLLI